jgi:hypothetical protein
MVTPSIAYHRTATRVAHPTPKGSVAGCKQKHSRSFPRRNTWLDKEKLFQKANLITALKPFAVAS